MVYLAFIYHMHQPYYKNLLTQETAVPWVRLHGIKDYLDMVQMLRKYPKIHLTFNLVPSLLEQVNDYVNGTVKDRFLDLSYKPAKELTLQEQDFILNNFFSINRERVVALSPRYYDLYFKRLRGAAFSVQDYLDLQVWFNLAWFDPGFRESIPVLKKAVNKARFFTEEEKRRVLDAQTTVLKEVIPAYKEAIASGQVEVTVSPYYHPILPLLYNTNIAREAYHKAALPKIPFSYPQDAKAQIDEAVDFFEREFSTTLSGMWPSEESVSEHIIPYFIQAGVRWIVTDEALLFKSLKRKKRDTRLLYKPHLLRREDGDLHIVFRDRNLSDLIGFEYYKWRGEDAARDLVWHLENIDLAFKGEDVLVTIALDGENAWEYYPNDGHDFLNHLYQKLSEARFLKTVTMNEYLSAFPAKSQIKRLGAGSWIFGNFGKWIGNPHKIKAWEYLALARAELEKAEARLDDEACGMAYKQMYILEGSDWFWWAGEDPDGSFDRLFRMHLSNFYEIIGKEKPGYLKSPLTT